MFENEKEVYELEVYADADGYATFEDVDGESGWRLVVLDNGTATEFFRHDSHLGKWTLKPAARRLLKARRLFLVDKYEHSGIALSLSGEGYSCLWDTTTGYALLVNDNAEDAPATHKERTEAARSYLNRWNHWANGGVYGFTLSDRDGRIVDACGGFLGCDLSDMATCIVQCLDDDYFIVVTRDDSGRMEEELPSDVVYRPSYANAYR